jgi:Flp pilus assembly pilin Flp
MRNLFARLWADDKGIVTIEYLVLGTFLALALVVGVHALAVGITDELTELSQAIEGFNQSYSVSGFSSACANTGASTAVDLPGNVVVNSNPVGTTQTVSNVSCTQ